MLNQLFLTVNMWMAGGSIKYLAICFQVSAYEEQLSHCEPQMDADERRLPDSSAFIRGL